MSIAGVEYRHVFGLKCNVNGNIHYVDDLTVAYPAGSNIVFYNSENSQQKFIHMTEKSIAITAFTVSTNKKWMAVAETGKKPQIVIHELSTFRKRKILVLPDNDTTEFVYLCFSLDTKILIAQTGAPDWTVYMWSWEKAKLMGSVRTANPLDKLKEGVKDAGVGVVTYQCLLSPTDSTLLSVVGNAIFKIFRLVDGSFRIVAAPKIDQKNVLAHCWTIDDRLICGTEDGKVFVFESSGELRNEFQHLHSIDQLPRAIRTVVALSKGFLIGCDGGSVVFYERVDEVSANPTNQKDTYRKAREYSIPDDLSNINKLAISPNEDSFVCSTDSSQMFYSLLSNTEVKGDESKLEVFSHPFHHNNITGMDTCIRKPLVVTCSTDRSVRVWNYSEDSSELVKYFTEESFSVSIHPSGLYVLVGFSDKLRLMNLLIDDIRPFREFTLRACRECRFSNGGQYFAAAAGNIIQIYSTWSFECLGNIKGHNGKVRSIYWTPDDSRIISAGADGAIYEWSLKDISGNAGQGIRRESESILKSCSYTSACMATDLRTIYAVGSDQTLKEIIEGQITRELESDCVLTQVLISQSGKVMIVGTASGAIRSMKYPFSSDAGVFQEHQAHSQAVTRLCMSHDDQYLFSVSEDGTFFSFKIYDKDGRVTKREREIIYADEILVTKSDLEEKNSMMTELKTKVEELKMENEYQLRLKDMNFNEKIKLVTEKFMQEIETLKITSTVLRTDKEKEELRHEEDMAEERERHSKDIADMENSQNIKLMAEYEKYQELKQKTADLQSQWEHQMKEMQAQKNMALEDLNKHFEERLKEKETELEKLQEEIKKHVQEFEETSRETERDADAEVMELRHRYEKKLRDERDIVMKLKGENGIMRKKFNTMQGEIDNHKSEISKMYNEEKKLHSVIKSLEKDITGLKKEIHERDETIQDKEKRIYDLKKKNQELEKFKFVLDYKIKELKKQIEPREKDILGMTAQIKEMDLELEGYNRVTSELDLAITDLKLKLKAAEKEVEKEHAHVNAAVGTLTRFKSDLEDMIQHLQDPKKLKQSLKKLYQKYCKDSKARDDSSGKQQEVQQEFARQREYLERTVASLRAKQLKDQKIHRNDNVRIMQETVMLLTEINHLRRDIAHVKQLERTTEVSLSLNKPAKGSSEGDSKPANESLPPLPTNEVQ